jgi:hypothetical protein
MSDPEREPNLFRKNHYVKRATLPSGAIIEVVHFDEEAHFAALKAKTDLEKMERQIDLFTEALQADEILPTDF